MGFSVMTAQVGINTTNPLAQLHIKAVGSTADGIIIPVMSLTERATMQAFMDNAATTSAQKDELSGFMFFVQGIDGENELWQCNRTTEKLEPVYRKPKAFVRSDLISSPAFIVTVDNHLEFQNEVIDIGDNFTSLADATGGTDPNLGGFVAKRKGIYEVYAQYHTANAVGTGEYGISIFKTPFGLDFSSDTERQAQSRSSFALTGDATVLNKVFRSTRTMVELEVGDRIDVFYNSDNAALIGGALDTSGTLTFMSVKQIMEEY